MNTFLLGCMFFWGEASPKFTEAEKALIDNCQQTYASLPLCEVAKVAIDKFNKGPGARESTIIIASCMPSNQ